MTNFITTHYSKNNPVSIQSNLLHDISDDDNIRYQDLHIAQPKSAGGSQFSNLGITRNTFSIIEDKKTLVSLNTQAIVTTSTGTNDGSAIQLYLKAADDFDLHVMDTTGDLPYNLLITLGTEQLSKGFFYSSEGVVADGRESLAVWELNYQSEENAYAVNLVNPGNFSNNGNGGLIFSIYSSIYDIDFYDAEFPLSAKNTITIARNNTAVIDYIRERGITDTEANFTLFFGCGDNTVSITGGANYQVGETFLIGGESHCDVPAILVIDEVDENGGVVEMSVSFSGENYFADLVEGDVVYYGENGTSADIVVNNLFIVHDYTINNPGKLYSELDSFSYTLEVREDGSRLAAFLPSYYGNIFINRPSINNLNTNLQAFYISDLVVSNRGYDHKDAPKITFTQGIENNGYVVGNANNFVSTAPDTKVVASILLTNREYIHQSIEE